MAISKKLMAQAQLAQPRTKDRLRDRPLPRQARAATEPVRSEPLASSTTPSLPPLARLILFVRLNNKLHQRVTHDVVLVEIDDGDALDVL